MALGDLWGALTTPGREAAKPHTAHGRRCVHRPVGRRTATYGIMPVRQDAPAGGTVVSPRADIRRRATGFPVAGESSVS